MGEGKHNQHTAPDKGIISSVVIGAVNSVRNHQFVANIKTTMSHFLRSGYPVARMGGCCHPLVSTRGGKTMPFLSSINWPFWLNHMALVTIKIAKTMHSWPSTRYPPDGGRPFSHSHIFDFLPYGGH